MKADAPKECDLDYLYSLAMRAYYEARKGKRKTFDEYKFEAALELNILNLVRSIKDRTYAPSRSVAFVISKPIVREIFAAPFRDRVVHHMIMLLVADWWDRHFIVDSYSCRKGKGTEFGISRLQLKIHQAYCDPRYKGERVYVLKFDISGYFMSMNRRYLFELVKKGLKKQFPEHNDPRYELASFLWYQTIMDDPTVGATLRGGWRAWKKVPLLKSLFFQPDGYGIVIGNVTSQLLSNIMLDELDRYVEFELGFVRRYGRYVDDFFIIIHESELGRIETIRRRIKAFLRKHGLRLHPRKFQVFDARSGVPFLGVMVFERHVTGGKRIVKNYRETLWEIRAHGLTPTLEIRLVSQIGHLKKLNCHDLLHDTLDHRGLFYFFAKYTPAVA